MSVTDNRTSLPDSEQATEGIPMRYRLTGITIRLTKTLPTTVSIAAILCTSWLSAAAETGGKALVALSGIKGGLVVHVGCGDGKLTAELAASGSFVVQGLDTNAANVTKARRHISSRGLYGRVSAVQWDGKRLPYADNLVNLIIGSANGVQRSEMERVVAPGGVILAKGGVASWTKRVKPRPDTIDEWTHWLGGPDGNAVSGDRVTGPPRHMQWKARPFWARLHDAPSTTSAMVSSNGRIFYIVDEGPAGTYAGLDERWFLIARDGFNGVLLWKKPLPKWGWKYWVRKWHARNNQPFQLPKRLVAIGDTVYVTLGFNSKLSALDAASGEVIRTYDDTDNTDEVLFCDGHLILSLNNRPHDPKESTPITKSVAVLKADTGALLWKKGDFTGVMAKTDSLRAVGRLELAAADGRVMLSERNAIAALDLKTGKNLWRIPRPQADRYDANFSTTMSELTVLVYSDGVVLYAQPQGGKSFHTVPGTLYAFSAADGSLLWKCRYGGWVHNTQPNIFVIDGLVWIHEHLLLGKNESGRPKNQKDLEYAVVGLELKTGKEKRRISTKKIFTVGHHHRCYRNKATERFLITSRRGVEFVDLATGQNTLHHWTRGECNLGVMPCNGLLYVTPHPCDCYIDTKLNGYFALAPARAGDRRAASADRPPVEKGPSFGSVTMADDAVRQSSSWPAFRGGPSRSGFAKTTVPTALKTRWNVDLGGTLGPVSVAGGKVFVPLVDEHDVIALNADDGAKLWQFTTGARVDTPPTLYQSMVYFGSADGRVYCLRASDGQPAWARRLAPEDTFIGCLDQLESRWPVHGSVLVQNGRVYAVAGRSSYVDGGIYLYAMHPKTGDIVEQEVINSADPAAPIEQERAAFRIGGMLADILVGDGSAVWMRGRTVFGSKGSSPGRIYASGGFRDDTWFNRTTWKMGPVNHAQLLVYDQAHVYGIEAFRGINRADAFTPGSKGYRFFAKALKDRPESRDPGENKGKKQRKGKKESFLWSRHIDIRATAMASADGIVFLAGAPDVVDPADPLAAFEGRKGMIVSAVSASDGKEINRRTFDSLPVWDGLAVSDGHLFIPTQSGRLICLGGEQELQ